MRTTWRPHGARQDSFRQRAGSGTVDEIARADQSRRLSNSVDAREGNGAMIISLTPLRMSFVGGGSDLPSYYREYGGAVLSTAINKYVYVTMNRKFDSGIRVAYSRVEEVNSVSEIEHQLVRAALNMAGVPGGVEITTVADIPSRGTGLGSSSSFTVALLHA